MLAADSGGHEGLRLCCGTEGGGGGIRARIYRTRAAGYRGLREGITYGGIRANAISSSESIDTN